MEKVIWVGVDWEKAKDGIPHTFEVQKKEITPYIDIYGIVEIAESNLKEDYKDELPDDWEICNFKETEMLKELDVEVNKVFKKWLKKYDRLPSVYKVKEMKSIDA